MERRINISRNPALASGAGSSAAAGPATTGGVATTTAGAGGDKSTASFGYNGAAGGPGTASSGSSSSVLYHPNPHTVATASTTPSASAAASLSQPLATTGPAGAGGSSDPVTATDAIIEELKALAKSMLEATNAARQRANQVEKRPSYEALMQAIDARTNNTAAATSTTFGNGGSNVGAPAAVPRSTQQQQHRDPTMNTEVTEAAAPPAGNEEELTQVPPALSPTYKKPTATGERHTRGDATKPATGATRGRADETGGDGADFDTSREADGAQDDDAAAAAEEEEEVDLHVGGKHTKEAAGTGYRSAAVVATAGAARLSSSGPTSGNVAAGGALNKSAGGAARDGAVQSHGSTSGGDHDDDGDDEDDDEEEDNVFDGVRTQVFFKSTDPKAYRDVAASAWKPERFLRNADGTATADLRTDGEEDDDDEGAEEKEEENASGSPSEADSADEAGADGVHRHPGRGSNGGVKKKAAATATSAVARKVYRVPSFPYGGGVTEEQAKQLSALFQECIRRGVGPTRSGGGPATVTTTHPRYISKAAFDREELDGVPKSTPTSAAGAVVTATTATVTTTLGTPFKPESPYEFVVEVDRPVMFDAVRAREERRRQFRRLVRQNRAPVTMGTFHLRVIMDPIKTGFEDEKNFPIVRGNIIADRYQIVQLLGKATFSRAVRCYDLNQPYYDEEDENEGEDDDEDDEDDQEGGSDDDDTGDKDAKARKKKTQRAHRKPAGYAEVCLKIINNTKDFFDQSLDEIRLLTLVNKYKDPDEAHVIRLIDAFYYKEHTMIVTELLSDNLYEYSKYNREEEEEFYFTLPRLRRLTRQIVEALAYVHSLNLIHADLKPENILFVSHRRCIVKVIDFGSSCFLSDHLSSYIQSRSYRAPEVVLGCDYDGRIDVWSLGAILVELVTGDVLFNSETVPEMLARIVYVCGTPFPRRMLWEGRHTNNFINKFGCIYESGSGKEDENAAAGGGGGGAGGHGGERGASEELYYIYTPVPPAEPASSPLASSLAASTKDELSTTTGSGAARAGGSPNAAKGSAFTVSRPRDGKTKTMEAAAPVDTSYSVLRQKLAAASMVDPDFFSFVKACLTLDHKKRPTSSELLSHPFITNERFSLDYA